MQKIGALGVVGFVSLCGAVKFDSWAEKEFPPGEIPELPPQPGYKVFGHMGCPEGSVEAIQEKARNLFFSKHGVAIPQFYALSRTSWLSRIIGKDRPVVVQIEILKDQEIKDADLWEDRQLKNPPPPMVTTPISYWPAIPPEIQKKAGLEVRVHHVVTSSVYQRGGHWQRAFARFSENLRAFKWEKTS